MNEALFRSVLPAATAAVPVEVAVQILKWDLRGPVPACQLAYEARHRGAGRTL